MPSSSISRSTKANASAPSASRCSLSSGVTSAMRPPKLLPMLTPPLTEPPLRVLAPSPSAGHLDEFAGGWGVGLPPIGRRLEIGMEDIGPRHVLCSPNFSSAANDSLDPLAFKREVVLPQSGSRG